MKKSKHFLLISLSFLLSVCLYVPTLSASSLSDIPPPEGVYGKRMPLTFGYDDSGDRAWQDDWKKVVEEAVKEWDDAVCEIQWFLIAAIYDVSFKWQNSNYFRFRWGDDYADVLGVYIKSEDEIYFNSDMPWDFTLGNTVEKDKYGFKWIVKHEIGHALGIMGDWGQTDVWPTPPSWASPDEIMWGVFEDGKGYDGLKYSDLLALQRLGYPVHIPEAATLVLVSCGLFGLIGLKRKLKA